MLVCLDRGLTVDVGEWAERRDPHQRLLSLAFVRWLAHETAAEVWATGNRLLVEEADVPGMHEVRRRLADRGVSAAERIEEYDPRYPRRADRVRMVGRLSDAAQRIVVDDEDRSHLEGWEHYTAWEFVEAHETGALGLPADPPMPLTTQPPADEVTARE